MLSSSPLAIQSPWPLGQWSKGRLRTFSHFSRCEALGAPGKSDWTGPLKLENG